MKKRNRIKKNSEFQDIFKSSNSFANRELVIYFRKKEKQTHFRLGISVGKKLGNAVTRNRIKRYIRESILKYNDKIKEDYDIIVIARNKAVQSTYHDIQKSLEHLLKKQNLFK